jgi:hypothetical protein
MVVQQGAGRIIGYEIDGEFGRPAVLQQPSRMPAQRVLDAIRRVYDLHGDDDAAL